MSNYTVITSDYLEHSRRDSIPNRFYFSHISNPTVTNGRIEFNVAFVYGLHKSNGSAFGRVIYTPTVYFVYDTGNRPSKEQLAKEIKPAITKMALNYSTPVSKEESDKAIDAAYKWVQRAPFSNTPISSKPFQTVKDEIRHSEDIDIIDVSDTLQHAQHEGYYSPNNTANKATPYIFDKLVKNSAGNQIGARFKGQGDRQWVEIFVPTVDFTPNMQNFIALFNAEKGNVKIREEEMRKAARLLTNFFNSPSLPGNEKMTTYVRKPKSLKHSLFTEVYDMDDYLEHHGVLGMKWGVRRYQNEDGSLTKEGREHYKIEGARFKERYKSNYELALKNANDARKAAIEKAKEGKNGAHFLNTALHQQEMADRYAKKLEKKSQGLVSFEKNKETEKLGKEIYEYYKDKPMGKFVAEAIVGSTAASLASFGLSAALGLPLFMVFATEPNRYELKDDKDKK